MSRQIKKAIDVFRDGGIVIFPTDTAIGIGCRIDNKKAVERLFRIKKRQKNKPMLVLVDSIEMAQEYWQSIPLGVLNKLIKKYWPGSLTIILYCNKVRVQDLVRGKGNTLGIRFPNDPILQRIINGVGVPIIAPSANFSGEETPFSIDDVNPELVKLADYVLNKKTGKKQAVSTVIDCTVEPWKIVREGAVRINY